ncbi:MAG TPA: NlpC/P60 family protein [Candidatus Nanoarchaeia archaeon]|nr:NlpC/P60 family protein [Candidatus Nanoarchaeia archaeon]
MKDIAEVALKYVGYPAISSTRGIGNTVDGFTCSGFIEYVLREAEIPIPMVPGKNRQLVYAVEFFDFFGISVHYSFMKKGDLVFFSQDGVRPTHIGLCVDGARGRSAGRMIHSPGEDGMRVSIDGIRGFIEIEYDKRRDYEQIYDKNPIGIKRSAILIPERRFQRMVTR